MSSAARTILVVGRRRRALEAVRSSGRRALLLADAPPTRRELELVADHAVCSANELEARVARAVDLCQGHRVESVIAAGERTVRAAARIRSELGLSGIDEATARRCTDKVAMKRSVAAAGVRCARYLTAEDGVPGPELASRLGLPLVLKRAVGSGGRETRVVEREGELPAELAPGWLAESFVQGEEMSLESLVHRGEPIFVNPTEYLVPKWSNVVPASIPDETLRSILELNRTALGALGIERGVTHLELFLTDDGPIFGEIALRPPGGYLMDLISLAYGFDAWRAWLEVECGRRAEVMTQPSRYAAVEILHPGPGTIRSIEGVEAARAATGVRELVLKGQPGQAVTERLGVGIEQGHLLVTGASRQEVIASLRAACELIRIEME